MERRDFLASAGAVAAGLLLTKPLSAQMEREKMPTIPNALTQPVLPYKLGDLAPLFSEEQMDFHYNKHHAAYFKGLAGLIAGKPEEKMTLDEIIFASRKAGGGPLFNNAAQAWNHTFFWYGMSPAGGGKPSGELLKAIERDFGGFDEFATKFQETGVKQFGSGWAWLVKDEKTGKLSLVSTSNAETPLGTGQRPLLTADVWEHAYYVDYRNLRADYLKKFFDKVNWEFVAGCFAD